MYSCLFPALHTWSPQNKYPTLDLVLLSSSILFLKYIFGCVFICIISSVLYLLMSAGVMPSCCLCGLLSPPLFTPIYCYQVDQLVQDSSQLSFQASSVTETFNHGLYIQDSPLYIQVFSGCGWQNHEYYFLYSIQYPINPFAILLIQGSVGSLYFIMG